MSARRAQYDEATMHLSYWEQDGLLEADCIVVGAGLIGLQTALELRALAPAARILVLERGALPAGASSRNAGFACFGSLTELLHDIDTLGADAALALVEQRWRGLQRLRSRVGDAAVEYEALGGYEVLTAAHLPALERIDEVNQLMAPLFRAPVFRADQQGLRRAGFGLSARALVVNPHEGQLHSGRLMDVLLRQTAAAGVRIHTGVQVRAVHESGRRVEVHADSTTHTLVFRAAGVALCTNGLLEQLAPGCGIRPARGQVLVTEPVPDLAWRGSFHMDQGYIYFRHLGNRVLLGGARNADLAGETSAEMTLTEPIQQRLEQLLQDTLLPGRDTRIAMRWAGIMGFSEHKQAVVRRVSPRVLIGFGCNGMGVALGADVAARTAALLLQDC